VGNLLPNRRAPGKRVLGCLRQTAERFVRVTNRSTMAYSCSSKARLALVGTVLLSGCGGVEAPTLSLPSVPSVGAISAQPTAPSPTTPGTAPSAAIVIDQTGGQGGSATDLYSRLATGAMKCWFATGAPLKNDYVYHATAAPASRGGKAQIVIHQRDPTQPNPRGFKSYVVDIDPTGESSATVKVENLKMSDAFAGAMTNDIARWTKGEEDCAKGSAVAGWTPQAPQPVASAASPAKTKGKKAHKAKAKPQPTQAKASARSSSKVTADN